MLKNSKTYIGNIRQLNDVRFIEFLEGKASNLKAYEIFTEAGLQMTILLDRGMDIVSLKVKGVNIAFLSATGLVNSTYFVEDKDRGFMNNFSVGFLTTGGLSYMGSSDSKKGLHGVISNCPAQNYGYSITDKEIKVWGNVHEAQMFGPNLVLHREIQISTKSLHFTILDSLKNLSDVESPYMVLYHNNFGYPFLDENTILNMPVTETIDRSGKNCKLVNHLTEPATGKSEKVYFNTLKGSKYTIKSPSSGLKLIVSMSKETLPVVNQWILERRNNYILGIEPGTNNVNGFEEAKRQNTLKYLKPDEVIKFNLDYEFQKLGV